MTNLFGCTSLAFLKHQSNVHHFHISDEQVALRMHAHPLQCNKHLVNLWGCCSRPRFTRRRLGRLA